MSAMPRQTAGETQTFQITCSFLEERKTKMRRRWFGTLLLIVLLMACSSQPPAGAPTSVSLPTSAPAAPAATAAPASSDAGGTVARKDILVIPSNVNIPAPDIWNP